MPPTRKTIDEEVQIVPTKYLAPFCLNLLGPRQIDGDDYAESLIFDTIDSSALTLEIELIKCPVI